MPFKPLKIIELPRDLPIVNKDFLNLASDITHLEQTKCDRASIQSAVNDPPNGNLKLDGIISAYNGLPTRGQGVAPIYTTVRQVAQGASISTTTLWTPTIDQTLFRVSVYHVCTTAGGAGTLDTTIGWTDSGAARTAKPAAQINLTGTNYASGILFLESVTTIAITYSTTVAGAAGNPKYAVYITLEELV